MAIKMVDAATLKSWIEKDEAVVVDVREPAEHAEGKIAGSILIPLANISQKTLPEIGKKKLVVHCQKGKRGGTACEKLLTENPDLEIYNLEGGISAWKELGNEVEAAKKCCLTLDRQVQLIIGSLVFIGSLLTYFVDMKFIIIPGFLGAGLAFAGATGCCMLKMMLAKMPWNNCGSPCKTKC